jgi:putative ABC transport system permease protein
MDKYADNTRNLYRVEMTDMWSASANKPVSSIFDKLLVESNEKNQVVMPVFLAEDLKENFKEISEVTRISYGFAPVVRVHNVSFKESGHSVAEIDSNFFTMMGLPLLQGNVQHPFDTKQSAVLSESAAKKYFGKSNPIGQVISISEMDHQQYMVSAIAADFPSNSSLRFDVMVPIIGNPYYERQVAQGTNSMSHITLFKLMEGTDIDRFQQQLNQFGKPYFESFVQEMQTFSEQLNKTGFRLSARPYREAHFNVSAPWPNFTDLKSLIQLILLAVIAIVIACVNYILLSLSRVAGRSQESGIRKTMGANTWHITKLFLSETLLLVAFSMLIGFVLAIVALPAFSNLSNVPLTPALLLKPETIGILLSICIVLTLAAGMYPAFKMAGISPLSMMRSFGTYKVNPAISKAFLTLQYTTCTVLIVMAIIIAQQMTHVFNKDLGFDK